MSWLKPRSIRGQLIFGLILLEGLLVVVFATLLVREQASEIHERARLRLESEASLLAIQSQESLGQGESVYLQPIVRAMSTSPNIRQAMITDPDGRVLASSAPSLDGKDVLSRFEKKQLSSAAGSTSFRVPGGAREILAPIHVHGVLRGYAWVYEDATAEWRQVYSLVRITIIFAVFGALGTAVIASFLARSITRPLNNLLVATRKLIRDPETKEGFPLEVKTTNEAADLTRAFNLMVTSIDEQRAGLNDTLALLDSMLANAPIGFAFFDRKFRYVRINQFLADMNQTPISQHLGRGISEMLADPAAEEFQACVQNVFETGQPVRDFELNAPFPADPAQMRSWLINVYPVKTASAVVRWVGAIIAETTEHKRSEEALRKTEKLAATGRLAASIAHEINNPLEAITNLLYLLQQEPSLDEQARAYARSAQHEISRVSEMTQQTLRFYRQSTFPAVANVAELLESARALFQGRVYALHAEVTEDFEPDVYLYCLAGELRQLFANVIGNALDALPQDGHIWLAVRRSRSWRDGTPGIRIFIADSGCGMTVGTRLRIFEPFFTTKDATGTGLGLWVSHEIIHKHNGSVRVRSRPREASTRTGKPSGTVFMMFFPEDGIGSRRLQQDVAVAQSA
jgi:signal transduction histidine kinase